MDIKFEAFDDTLFNTAEEAFDYEWREKYPDLRIYDARGNTLSSMSDTDEYVFFYHVNSEDELRFVTTFLRIVEGEIEFYKSWTPQYSDDDGYILETENEISYISPEAFKDYWGNDLGKDTDLFYELEEGD